MAEWLCPQGLIAFKRYTLVFLPKKRCIYLGFIVAVKSLFSFFMPTTGVESTGVPFHGGGKIPHAR